jgi:transketolase
MVCGVPETFLADVSTGNLATATTLDRPTELVFMEKQEAWREDLTIIANGLMVGPALDAAEALAAEGISVRVLDMHTVKPIDRDALKAAAEETGAIVVAEEHLAHGGLGSVVAMNVAEIKPVPIRYVNLGDQFGESGSPEALIEAYGLTAANVASAARAVLAAKKS